MKEPGTGLPRLRDSDEAAAVCPIMGGPRRFWYVCTQEKPQVTPLPRNPLPYSMYVRSVSDSVFSGAAGERDRHARENERVSLRNEENHVLIGFTQRKENLIDN